MMEAQQLVASMPVGKACKVLGIPRANYYRHQQKDALKASSTGLTVSPLALSPMERKTVLDVLHEERFIDKSPQEIHAGMC